MAWSDPPARQTGDLVTAEIWNADVVDNLLALRAENFRGVYDSGWFAVTLNTLYQKAHGLGGLADAVRLARRDEHPARGRRVARAGHLPDRRRGPHPYRQPRHARHDLHRGGRLGRGLLPRAGLEVRR